jgi:Polyketide cyclase / dehydrase and lipid transport
VKGDKTVMGKVYKFVTVWKIEAPVEKVWDAITDSLKWPEWWKGVEKVVELEKGDADGIGSLRRYTWKSALPYRLSFDMRLTKMEKYKYLEGDALGELQGKGIWHFKQDGNITTIRYNWDVSTTKAWMNLVSPLLKPAFEWNHDYVMKSGGEGLAKLLGAKRLSTEEERAKKDSNLPVLASVAGLAASAGVVVLLARRKKPDKNKE